MFRRITVLFLCVALLCSIIAGVSADPEPNTGFYGYADAPLAYPVTSRFMRTLDSEGYAMWYQFELPGYSEKYSYFDVLASTWCKFYCVGDPEVWPKEYLDRFETVLAGAYKDRPALEPFYGTWLYEHTFDSFSWDDDTLKVTCSAEYDITYWCTFDRVMCEYTIEVYGGYPVYLYLAFTDKVDGSLVNMGRVYGFALSPEYRYGSAGYTFNSELIAPELLSAMNKGESINYRCTDTETFEVAMPDFFDPEKHDITLYFQVDAYDGLCAYLDERCFYDPVEISSDGYGIPEPEPDVTTTVTEKTEPDVTTTVTEKPEPEPEPIMGDVDENGAINLLDASLLLKYIADWPVELKTDLADVNGSGRIGLDDVSRILKIIAGWDV